MKDFLCTVAAAVAAFATFAAAPEPVGYAVTMNHPDAMYRVGEKAVLTLTATDGVGKVTSGTVKVTMDNYGSKSLGARTVDLARENPFTLELALDEPGFACVKVAGAGRSRPFVWGVGYEPERIVAGGEVPADFDAFWKKGVENLAATVPLDPRMMPVPEKSKGAFDYYRISFATLGDRRVYGFLTVPKGEPGAKYPVSVQVSSAGVGSWTVGTRGLADRITMYFIVYDFDPPEAVPEARKLYDEMNARMKAKYGVASYSQAGLSVSPEDYFFYPVVLGINRAIDWLWERPDVDRTRFGYEGGSQGGCFGWMLCGLNPRFTSAVLRVPAMSDVRGCLAGHGGCWPYAVEDTKWNGQDREAVIRNIAYFDGASFAPRIRIPIRVVVGLTDTTCPPNAVHATFNRLASEDKRILNAIGCGHGGQTRAYDEIARKWQYGR